MGVYDYKDYSERVAAEKVVLAKQLGDYVAGASVLGLPVADIVESAEGLLGVGTLAANDIDLKLPPNWREVSVAELGLDPRLLDPTGYIRFMSPLTGYLPTGPQLKVLAETDASGRITSLAVGFAPTNSPLDVIDFLQLNKGALVPSMVPVLEAVRDLAVANGLTGEDVTITGYSLGAGMTNIMARAADTLVGGFYADSDYFGFAAPVIDESGRVLNVGHENDVVHRATGNATSFWDAVVAADPLLSNNDASYSSSTDNFVLFDSNYAASEVTLAIDSILNPFAWWAHIAGVISDATDRVANSQFYSFMDQDSVIVVQGMAAPLRPLVWVRDKAAPTSDHFGDPAFIIGSIYADKLADGASNDWLEGLAGNDTIRVSTGLNRVDGGTGRDTLELTGKPGEFTVYRLADGDIAFASAGGLTIARGIEDVQFRSPALFGLTDRVEKYSVQGNRLENEDFSLFELGDSDIAYASSVSGSAAANTLSGRVVFGLGGDDRVGGTTGADLLHGGEGADRLEGLAGNDRLYGAEGADTLIGGGGTDRLNGGEGDDVFVFNASQTGRTVIEDFNAQSGDTDLLQLLGGNAAASLASARVVNGDLEIRHGNAVIVLDGVTEISADWLL